MCVLRRDSRLKPLGRLNMILLLLSLLQQQQQKREEKDDGYKIESSDCDSGANIFIFAYKQISVSLLFIVLVRSIVLSCHRGITNQQQQQQLQERRRKNLPDWLTTRVNKNTIFDTWSAFKIRRQTATTTTTLMSMSMSMMIMHA